ncbi:hypothetical protein [Desulfosporosinus sp. FKB]|uniref:hypothetical protein n=1 Tax=Desulfosporosinus sp. FKB TaxID=1969835 RepID=UPI000B4A1A54|nr:hypothetical protein [Desulfosporosinus sp. FKB]
MVSNIPSQTAINLELKTTAIERLEHLLTEYESGSEKFTVFGLVAGGGKTQETIRIIASHILNGGQRNYILVIKQNIEVMEYAYTINKMCGHQMALPITCDNWRELRNNPEVLWNYRVLVITHKRYQDLCTNPRLRRYFEKNRHTLVIDEQLDVPTVSLSEKDYEKIIGYLPWTLHNEFIELCRGLISQIVTCRGISNRMILTGTLVDHVAVKTFRSDLQNNWTYIDRKNEVSEFMKSLEVFSLFPALYNNGKLHTVDYRIVRWKLQNNIILDANAEIDFRYKIDPDMNIESQPQIMNYSGSTIHVANFNSTRNNINKTENYFHEIAKAIRKWKSSLNKTLVIVDKKHQDLLVDHLRLVGFQEIGQDDDYQSEDIAVAHFGDILGKNHWRDFDQVWVIVTPLMPMPLYPLHWSYLARIHITDQNLEMFGTLGKYSFRDPIFEDTKVGCLVSEIYQAIKRINRDNSKPSRSFLVQSDERVVEGVIRQFPGIKIGEPINLDDVEYKEGKKSNKIPRPIQLANLLRDLDPGTYTKKYLYDRLGWPPHNKLGRYFTDPKIKELEAIGLIKILTRKVEVYDKAA